MSYREPSEEGGGGGAPDRRHSNSRGEAGSEAGPRGQEPGVGRGEAEVAAGVSPWPRLTTPDVADNGGGRGEQLDTLLDLGSSDQGTLTPVLRSRSNINEKF